MYFDPGVDSRVISEFPNYCITVDGRVFNLKTGREMVLHPTLQGEYSVGMMKDRVQYRRSVKVLVAEAFVEGQTEDFNTPILLDNNKENLHATNICWRPRWFAWRYSYQFSRYFPDWYYHGPILDIVNNAEYLNIIEAATTNGILCEDIQISIDNRREVFPTGQVYTNI